MNLDEATRIHTLDDETFLGGTTGEFTFVDFWAPWCAPCRRLAPSFEAAAKEYGDRVRFAKCDVDVSPKTAELMQIQTIPTVVLFDPDGNEIGRVVNPPPGSFTTMVDEVVREKRL